MKKNLEMVKLLTRYGADVNKQDVVSTACPLYLAMKVRAPVTIIDHLLYNSRP